MPASVERHEMSGSFFSLANIPYVFYRSGLNGLGLVLFAEQKCRSQFSTFIEPCRSTLLVVTGAVCRYHV
jgi:hypothetical protein